MNDRAHWLKQRVIAREWLRHALRRRVLAPYQRRQLRRVVRALSLDRAPAANAPAVLVLAFRHWAISRAWETVMSRMLLGEGCRVVWLECDRALVRCDGMTGPQRDLHLCAHCCAFNRAADAIAGVERLSMQELTPPGEAEAIAQLGRGVPPADLEQAIAASFQRIRSAGRRRPEELTPDERRIRDELLVSAVIARQVAARALDRLRPVAVLALNGKFFTEAIFLAEAHRRGIQTWTYERGNRRDTVALARGRAAIPFDARTILATLHDQPLTPEQRARIESYLAARAELGNGQVRFLARDRRGVADLVRGGERLIALFTNLIWDSSVVGEDTIFRDMFAWIETAIATVEGDPHTALVIRIHPAEEKVYWHPTRERVEDVLRARLPAGLPPNVRLVRPSEPLDSYALARAADLVLVYASSIGMEAAALGKRVVVAANSSYATAPFVVRPGDHDAFVEELRSRRREPPVADAPELALRFMYRLYFEEMLPVPAVREDPTGFHVRSDGPARGDVLRQRLRRLLGEAHGTLESQS
jgi:hypothetical protein